MADLRDLPDAEFEQLLQQAKRGQAQQRPVEDFPVQPAEQQFELPPELSLTPRTDQAASETGVFSTQMPQPGAREGARAGVPLSQDDLPFTKQLLVDLHRRPIDKFRTLQRQFGPENVEVAESGNFVVRNQLNPDTGTAQDLEVPKGGISASSLIASLPEIVGGIVVGSLGRGAGAAIGNKLGFMQKILATTGNLVGMAVGGETAGAVKDAAVRAFGGDPIEADEIVKERAKDATWDFAIGAALGTGFKAASLVVSPFSNPTAAQQEARAATGALERLAGESMPQTPAERTGSRLLRRVEAQFAKQPGSSMAFDAMAQEKDDFIRGLQNRYMLGVPKETPASQVGDLLPSQQATGERALGTLGSQALQLEGQVARAAQAVETTGTQEAARLTGVTGTQQINPTTLGETLRGVVRGGFDAFKAKAGQLYEDFLSKPEISSRIVPLDTLAKDAAKMEATLPSAVSTKLIPAYDAYGSPTAVAKTSLERLDAFIAPKVRTIVDRITSLNKATTSINDLKQIRTSIDDAIAEGISIPGTDVSQLRQLRGMVNNSIEEGLSGLPNGAALLKEWHGINDFYRNGIKPYDRAAIQQILVNPGEPNSIGNTALVERTFGKSAGAKDVYDEYKSFFGQNSVEFKGLQKAIAEDAIGVGATRPGTSVIDGKKLLANLEGMRPEVAQDILGVKQDELRRIGEALSAAQGSLDVNELSKLAASKSLTAQSLLDLISAEGNRAAAYRNRLINAAAKGALAQEKIQPAEFVRYMANKASAPEVSEVLGRLQDQPDLLQQIRVLAGEEFLSHAGVGINTSSSAITKTFGDRARQDVWRAMLGDQSYQALRDMATSFAPAEKAAQAYATAGGMSAGQLVSQVFGKGELSAVPGILIRALGSFIYTGPGRVLANNLVTPTDVHRFTNAIIASEEFWNYMTGRFGVDRAREAADTFREAMNKVYEKDLKVQGKVPLGAGERVNLKNLSDAEFEAYLQRARQ